MDSAKEWYLPNGNINSTEMPKSPHSIEGIPGVSINNGSTYYGSLNRPRDEYNKVTEPTVYKRRWYILFVFSLLCFCQNAVWNCWGPLVVAAASFDMGSGTIAMLTNWGMIAYVITVIGFCWLLDSKGNPLR